jgi:hypothetical protein
MMQSLELNRRYYHECVAGVLREHCPWIVDRHAAALIGWGSEILGNDDELSKDYGWGPRLLLFLTLEDHDARADELLAILQQNIPPTFLGHPTRFTDVGPPQPTTDHSARVAIQVTTCESFTRFYIGLPDVDVKANPPSSKDWLLINEERLLRLTAGEVFHDGIGMLTSLREYFGYFPDDVWRHRLAYAWSTLDRYARNLGTCESRGELLSSRIVVTRIAECIIAIVFLLNRVYKPGYMKWVHRQFHKLPHLSGSIGATLEKMMSQADNSPVSPLLGPVLDEIIPFQSKAANIPPGEYSHIATRSLKNGCCNYNLEPIIDSVRRSIEGELKGLQTTLGAVDQWIVEQDLLMVPPQLGLLAPLYDCDDPLDFVFSKRDTLRPAERGI